MSTGLPPDIDRPRRLPMLSPESLVVLASVATSLAGGALLGETMRIRWSIGTYYGPSHASTALVLFAFPLALLVLLAAFRALASVLARRGVHPTDVRLVRRCGLVTLGSVLAAQVLLIALNVV